MRTDSLQSRHAFAGAGPPAPRSEEADPAGIDPEALAAGLVQLLPKLRSHVERRIGRTHADDVVQESMLRALQRRASFEEGRELWPWLRTVANHVADRRFASDARGPALDESVDPLDLAGAHEDRSFEDHDEVANLLGRLGGTERQVLDRFYLRGQTLAQIATEDDAPVGTVKAQLFRARQRLMLIVGGVSTVLAALVFFSPPSGSPLAPGASTSRIHSATFTVENIVAPVPQLRRVERGTVTSSGWAVTVGSVPALPLRDRSLSSSSYPFGVRGPNAPTTK